MNVRLSAAAVALILAACEQTPKLANPPSPSDEGRVYPDLPLPPGFIYRGNVSDKSPTGAFRVVNQTAEAKNRRLDLAAKFIGDVFPRHGWKLENEDRSAAGGVTLVFVKKEERCRVQLSQKDRTTVAFRLNVNRKD